MISECFQNPIEVGFRAVGISEGFLCAVAFVLVILLSLSAHEYAHGFVALKNGDPTARDLGRLTLNPIKHVDLIGILMLLFCGFGWAKPVPVDARNMNHPRRGWVLTSLAGIVANLLSGFICALGLVLASLLFRIEACRIETIPYVISYFCYALCYYGLVVNVSLALFNLLPIFPLDGFHVLEALVGHDTPVLRGLRRYGVYVLLLLVLIGSFAPQFDLLGIYINEVGGAVIAFFLRVWSWIGG